VCPQPVLESSQGEKALLDDIAGSDLRLIVRQTADMRDITNVQVLRDLAPGLQILLVRAQDSLAPGHGEVYRDVDNVLIDWMKEHDTRALLVRPDHYVYGGDNSVDGVIDLCRRFARQIRSGAESHAR
jgi:3-(3-hydroxy-phenyl)propionate hydroxylase